MIWPWVSRAEHNEVTDAYRHILEQSHAVRRDLETRYADLLGKYHELKLAGAKPKEPEPVIERTPIDPVTEAVNAASAGMDGKVRVAMLRQVAVDRNAGLSTMDIIARIQRGNRPAEEVV